MKNEPQAKIHRSLFWLLAAVAFGVLLAFTITLLAFRFYVNIDRPLWVILTACLLFAGTIRVYRARKASKVSFNALNLTFAAQLAIALLTAYGTVHLLLSIYPPNFS